MRKENDISTPPAKPWQPRWWRENPERWRWAGTIAIVFVLMGTFAYQNPHIWHNSAPRETARENNPAQMAAGEAPAANGNNTIPEPRETASVTGVATDTEPVATEPQQAQQTMGAEDTEPDGMQELEAATAVSAAPSSWLQPGYGEWSRDYGYALDPTHGDYRFHHGWDMDLSVGSPVFAAAAGRVLLAAEDAAWGGLVIVEHGGGWRSIYKCVQPEVSVGAELVAGEQLGVVLSSPPAEQAQPSHMHFEMLLEGQGQNPANWL